MSSNPQFFAWIDLETTGLNPYRASIVEMHATLASVTKRDGIPAMVAHQRLTWTIKEPPNCNWDRWCVEQHQKSGLIDQMMGPGAVTWAEASTALMTHLRMWKAPKHVALAGRGCHFERAFFEVHFPELIEFLHHRVLDMASVEMFLEHLGLTTTRAPNAPHRAQADIDYALGIYQRYVDLLGTHVNGKEVGY